MATIETTPEGETKITTDRYVVVVHDAPSAIVTITTRRTGATDSTREAPMSILPDGRVMRREGTGRTGTKGVE